MVFFRRMLKNSLWLCTAYILLFSIILYTISIRTVQRVFSEQAESTMNYTASKINDYFNVY